MRFGIACLLGLIAFNISPAEALDSKAQVAAEPRAAYAFLKKAYKPEIPHIVGDEKYLVSTGENLSLYGCAGVTDMLLGGKVEPLLYRLSELAVDLTRLEYLLSAFYPATPWKSGLNAYEEQMLALLADQRTVPKMTKAPNDGGVGYQAELDFKLALATKLNEYRKTHHNLPEVQVGVPGCGDGDLGVQIVTRPEAKRIRFISRYAFELCTEQKIDPLNQSQCGRWIDYSGEDSFSKMAGRLKVLVNWPDGYTSPLYDLDVDTLVPDKKGNLRFVIQR